MFQAYKITGDTYPNRRAIRALGGVWHHDEKAYFVPPGAYLGAMDGVEVELVELDFDPFRPLEGEELRAHRQARQDRYRARLEARADSAERRAHKAQARIKPHERDFLRLMEPVKIGHHSQRRHEKLIDRACRSFEDAGREFSEASRLRQRAESLAPVRVAGDAAREAKARHDAARAVFGLGDKVRDIVRGEGVICKVNPVSVLVRRADGSDFKTDPANLSLVEKGDGKAPAKDAPRFKAGDAVLWHRHGYQNKDKCKPWRAVILRRTPRGWSVSYTLPGRREGEVFAYKQTVADCNLEAV